MGKIRSSPGGPQGPRSPEGARPPGDPLPVDLAGAPGDTVIELRDGVPYIYTVPVAGAFLDVTDLLTTPGVLAAGFIEKEHPRDPHTGKWIRDPAGKFLDAAANDLKFQQRVSHNGHVIDRTKAGFTVKLKTGERQHYDKAEHAAEAARRGKHLTAGDLGKGAGGGDHGPKPPKFAVDDHVEFLTNGVPERGVVKQVHVSPRGMMIVVSHNGRTSTFRPESLTPVEPPKPEPAGGFKIGDEVSFTPGSGIPTKGILVDIQGDTAVIQRTRPDGRTRSFRHPLKDVRPVAKPEPSKPDLPKPPEPTGDAYQRQLFDNLSRSLGGTDLTARQVRDLHKEQALPGSSLRKLSDSELKGLGDQAAKRLHTDRHAGVIEGLVNEERSRRNNDKPGGGGALGWSSAGANYHFGKDSSGQIAYTLHYAPGGGWDVFEGHRPAVSKGDQPLHHAGNAREAKAWAEQHSAGKGPEPAALKPEVSRPEPPKPPVVDPGRTLSAKPSKPGNRSPLEAKLASEYLLNGGKIGGFDVKDRDDPNTIKNLQLYGRVPPEIRRQLAAQGVEIHVGTRPVTELDDLAGWAKEQPSGYAKGDTYGKVAAMVTKRGKATIVALGGGHRTYGSSSVNVSAHEAAHALDFSSGGISDEHEFLVMHKRAKAAFGEHINPYYVQARDPRQGAKEFLAETYAAWVEYRADPDRALKIMQAVARHDGSYHDAFVGVGADLAAFYDRLWLKIQRKQEGHGHGAGH